MFVVFIHGPAAAGKHTIGKLVAERLEIPLFHNHLTVDLARSLFPFGSAPFRQLRADIWHVAFRECANAGQSFVFTFHPEATVARSTVEDLINAISRSGGSVIVVELLCARATLLDRLPNDSRQRFGKLTDPDLYETIEAEGGFEFDGLPDPDIQINTDLLDPEQAATVILQSIQKRVGA